MDFDGLKARNIFLAWMGGDLSQDRLKALLSIFFRAGLPVTLLTEDTIQKWEVGSSPIHPLVQNLSAVHKADYYRAYLMHHYGGGYTDVKPLLGDWVAAFELLEASDRAFICGYEELSDTAVVQLPGDLGNQLRESYRDLLGICAMVCKPRTEFTSEWLQGTNALLDRNRDSLIANPSQGPVDYFGRDLGNGQVSRYPFGWTGVGGAIFHPTLLKYKDRVIKANIMPQVWGYR